MAGRTLIPSTEDDSDDDRDAEEHEDAEGDFEGEDEESAGRRKKGTVKEQCAALRRAHATISEATQALDWAPPYQTALSHTMQALYDIDRTASAAEQSKWDELHSALASMQESSVFTSDVHDDEADDEHHEGEAPQAYSY